MLKVLLFNVMAMSMLVSYVASYVNFICMPFFNIKRVSCVRS